MREVVCHTVNLFYEARGESAEGKRWVLDVVKNRVKSDFYPRAYSICQAVTARNQFEWYFPKLKKYLDGNGGYGFLLASHLHEMDAIEDSFERAFLNYFYQKDDTTGGSLYYMTLDKFVERLFVPFRCTVPSGIKGNHVFFVEIPCAREEKEVCSQY